MQIETIDVFALREACHLSPIRCADFSEAAAVCLDYHHHQTGVPLRVEGDLQSEFELVRKEVTQQMRDSRSDMDYTVESGAYCIAMLVVERLTKQKVVKQSQREQVSTSG